MSQLGTGAGEGPGPLLDLEPHPWGSATAPASACLIPLPPAGPRAEDPVQRISSIPGAGVGAWRLNHFLLCGGLCRNARPTPVGTGLPETQPSPRDMPWRVPRCSSSLQAG